MSDTVWMPTSDCSWETAPKETPARSAIDLLRAFHEYADKWENHVATNETYFSMVDDDGEQMISGPYRRWYWRSDLRRQTILALTAVSAGVRDG